MEEKDAGQAPGYRLFAGELVADTMALLMAVLQRRPELAQVKSQGAVLTVDLGTRRVTLGLRLGGDRALIAESFPINPGDSDTFGVSDLAIQVPPKGKAH